MIQLFSLKNSKNIFLSIHYRDVPPPFLLLQLFIFCYFFIIILLIIIAIYYLAMCFCSVTFMSFIVTFLQSLVFRVSDCSLFILPFNYPTGGQKVERGSAFCYLLSDTRHTSFFDVNTLSFKIYVSRIFFWAKGEVCLTNKKRYLLIRYLITFFIFRFSCFSY